MVKASVPSPENDCIDEAPASGQPSQPPVLTTLPPLAVTLTWRPQVSAPPLGGVLLPPPAGAVALLRMVNATAADVVLLPAASRARATTECWPSESQVEFHCTE